MERPVPMDRLVCGDVGFGKTEVAIRAAFKAIQDGKQVAVLVPTTLLAPAALPDVQRPLRRLPGPGRGAVAGSSRPRRPSRWPRACASARSTCVIGTHRLLSDDIQFKDLGLLVVDEEQRFGVTPQGADQAARKTDVDVLTLTATPIPRTLEMSLTGIRDLTLLQHAAGRAPADPHLRRRVRRAGRSPRRSAASCCARARCSSCTTGCRTSRTSPAASASSCPRRGSRSPTARWTRARSRQVVLDFWEGEYDVLVCTTIIESGIDMPTVNTLVVDRADLLGLGQLHQLRGRVGRAGQRAYAYLFHPARPGAHRGGLRAAQDDRRGDRARLGLQDRHARPRDPRRRQPARHRPVRPHRRRRLRPLLPDGQRGGGRAEGRAGRASRPRSSSTCPLDANLPPDYVAQGGAAARGVPAAGRGHHRRPRSTTSGPSGRTATARCPPAAEALLEVGPPAGRVRAASASARSTSPRARRSAARRYTARVVAAAAQDQPADPPDPACSRAPCTRRTADSSSCQSRRRRTSPARWSTSSASCCRLRPESTGDGKPLVRRAPILPTAASA